MSAASIIPWRIFLGLGRLTAFQRKKPAVQRQLETIFASRCRCWVAGMGIVCFIRRPLVTSGCTSGIKKSIGKCCKIGWLPLWRAVSRRECRSERGSSIERVWSARFVPNTLPVLIDLLRSMNVVLSYFSTPGDINTHVWMFLLRNHLLMVLTSACCIFCCHACKRCCWSARASLRLSAWMVSMSVLVLIMRDPSPSFRAIWVGQIFFAKLTSWLGLSLGLCTSRSRTAFSASLRNSCNFASFLVIFRSLKSARRCPAVLSVLLICCREGAWMPLP